jgi:hypothetical protein
MHFQHRFPQEAPLATYRNRHFLQRIFSDLWCELPVFGLDASRIQALWAIQIEDLDGSIGNDRSGRTSGWFGLSSHRDIVIRRTDDRHDRSGRHTNSHTGQLASDPSLNGLLAYHHLSDHLVRSSSKLSVREFHKP